MRHQGRRATSTKAGAVVDTSAKSAQVSSRTSPSMSQAPPTSFHFCWGSALRAAPVCLSAKSDQETNLLRALHVSLELNATYRSVPWTDAVRDLCVSVELQATSIGNGTGPFLCSNYHVRDVSPLWQLLARTTRSCRSNLRDS